MRKYFRRILSGVIIIVLFIACSEDTFYYGNDKQVKDEILQLARELLDRQGATVPLSINGIDDIQSRSGLSTITEAVPLWEHVTYYNIDGIQVLMVDLKTTEEVFSRIATTRDGIEIIQESTTFSKLVIRKKGTDVYANVLTYMPESNYAAANKERLDTIGYYPYYVDFTGITLTSHLDGNIFRGIRYEDGKIVGMITKEKPNACSHEHHKDGICTHEHMVVNYNMVNINLFTQSSLQLLSRSEMLCPTCFSKIDEYGRCENCDYWDCPQCGEHTLPKDGGWCLKCGFYEIGICPSCLIPYTVCGHTYKDFCQNCGELNKECVCDIDSKICPDCLNYKNACTCPIPNPILCDKCGLDPCKCPNPPSPDFTPDTCDICLTYPCKCCDNCRTFPCECVINTTPIEYVVHEGDWLVGEPDCISVTTCCPMAVLEMAHKALGGTGMTQEIFTQYYTQINIESPNEETVLEYNDSFMTQFFSTNTTSDISEDIGLGNVVVIRQDGHYLLAFGLQYDGDLIYADLHVGVLYAVNESYFSECDTFIIDGLANGEKSIKL